MNGKNYLGGLKYYARLNCSNGFFDFIAKRFEKVLFDKQKVIKALDEEIKRLENIKGVINQEKALKILIAQDLRRLRKIAPKHKIEEPEPRLEKLDKFYVKESAKLGLRVAPHKLFLVEKFPSIWRGSEKNYTAVGLGEGYRKYYDIEPGNYILRQKMNPIFTDGILLPHEITHHIFNYYSDTEFGRGLEEGICDFFGHFLGAKLIGYEAIKNSYIYSYLYSNIERSQEDYYLFFKQASYIYLNYGLKGIIALIKGGRRKLREVEQYLEAGEFNKIKLPKGNWIKELTDIVNYICLTYMPQLYVSPLARYIADYIKVGDDLEELRTRLNIDKKQFKKAIKELDDDVDVTQCYKGKVNYSVLPYILKAEALRYKVKY